MGSNLVIDIGPAVGGHGQRGIGRYVRGLAASVGAFPEDLSDRIWALGFPGSTLESFGARAVPFPSIPGLGRAPTWATGRYGTNAALRKSGARVLHATDPQRPAVRRDVATIVTVYDLIPLREREVLRSWRLDHRAVYRWYIRQIKSAARVIAISRTTAEDLQERLGVQSERIDIVYPLVTSPANIDRIDPPEPTFLCVGAQDPHKQPELALRAFARFRACLGSGRLRYVGPSDTAQERRLRGLAAQLGVTGSVSFEGLVSDGDLEGAYASATALVSTSRIEGFGLPSVEALLRGVPVIAVESAAAIETLAGMATLVPGDAEAISEAMTSPVKPPAWAVDVIRERYSTVSVAGALADSYRQILA